MTYQIEFIFYEKPKTMGMLKMALSPLNWLWVLWSGAVVWIVEYMYYYIRIRKEFIYNGDGASIDDKIIFQITTKYCPEVVERAVLSIRRSCELIGFSNYEIWIVTDRDAKVDGARVIIVPDDFKCKAKFKARALEYSRRLRKPSRKIWIYFMDEECFITEQTIKALTYYIKKWGEERPIASGPLLFINGGEKLLWYADALRTFQCYACAYNLKRRGFWFLHGENTLVRSDIEQLITWEFETLIEDAYFSIGAKKLGVKMGWHGGVIYAPSPQSFIDFIKQRRRWFSGWIKLIISPYSKGLKALIIYHFIPWALSGLGLITSFLGISLGGYYLPLPLSILFSLTSLMFIFAYLRGLLFNTMKLRDILAALLYWLYAFVEGIALWYSIIKPAKTFDIIKKELDLSTFTGIQARPLSTPEFQLLSLTFSKRFAVC